MLWLVATPVRVVEFLVLVYCYLPHVVQQCLSYLEECERGGGGEVPNSRGQAP